MKRQLQFNFAFESSEVTNTLQKWTLNLSGSVLYVSTLFPTLNTL